MKLRPKFLILLGVGLLLIWFTHAAVRAHQNLVTLNVRNADLKDVLRKIAWQTWEIILVNKQVQGKITLHVRNMPLEEVLKILADQTASRWTALYPLYTQSKSLAALKRAVRGEVDPAQNGWTNLSVRPLFGPLGGFGENARNQNNLVSVEILGKDLEVATTALARFARAEIVPEDGAAPTINLTLSQTPIDQAVQKLARQAGRKWTKWYALRGGRFGGLMARGRGTSPLGSNGIGTAEGELGAIAGTNANPGLVARNEEARREQFEQWRQSRERMFQEQLDTMTPEQRERAEQQRQRFEALRQLTPEERRQRVTQMAQSPEFQERIQERMLNGIKNTTPEQRAERDQRIAEIRKRFEPRQAK
jgi:hypothetical protein